MPDPFQFSAEQEGYAGRPWSPAGAPPYTGEIPRVDTPVPEQWGSEFPEPEFPVPELAEPEFPEPEFPEPEFPEPELTVPEFPEPELVEPEFPKPMLPAPDPAFAMPPPAFPPMGTTGPPVGTPPHTPEPTGEYNGVDDTNHTSPYATIDSLFGPPTTRGFGQPGQARHSTPAESLSEVFGFPEPSSSSEPSGPTRKTSMLIAIPATLAVLAGLAILAAVGITQGRFTATGDSSRPPGGQRPPAARPSAGAPDGQGGVPEGFRRYQDRAGFSLLVPKSWGKPQRKPTGVFFYAPDDNRRYIQIASSTQPAADAYTAWRKLEQAKKRTLPDYRRIQLKKINYPGAVTAADWEFTWTGVTARMHILDRTFVINGRGTAILVSAPDKKWNRTFKQLQPVLNSYRPA